MYQNHFDVGLDYPFPEWPVQWFIDFCTGPVQEDILLARNLPPTSGYTSVLQTSDHSKLQDRTGLICSFGQNRMDSAGIWTGTLPVTKRRSPFGACVMKMAIRSMTSVTAGLSDNNPRIFRLSEDGIYQANEVEEAATREAKVPGEIKLDDTDGNGIISANDQVILGTDVRISLEDSTAPSV